MKVSIVIPALNEADFVGQAVQSAWRAGAAEVIVADGGSVDGTASIAKDLGCAVVATTAGRAVQQNAGAGQSRGDVLLFQHADNWLDPGAIRQIHQALSPPRVMGGAFRQRIDADGISYRLLEWGNTMRAKLLGLPYGDQGIFLRREFFFALGGFPGVRLFEDLLLMKKFRRRSWPVLLRGPIHVSARRWQKQGVVRQTLRNWSLLTAYQLGVPLHRLADFYARHDA